MMNMTRFTLLFLAAMLLHGIALAKVDYIYKTEEGVWVKAPVTDLVLTKFAFNNGQIDQDVNVQRPTQGGVFALTDNGKLVHVKGDDNNNFTVTPLADGPFVDLAVPCGDIVIGVGPNGMGAAYWNTSSNDWETSTTEPLGNNNLISTNPDDFPWGNGAPGVLYAVTSVDTDGQVWRVRFPGDPISASNPFARLEPTLMTGFEFGDEKVINSWDIANFRYFFYGDRETGKVTRYRQHDGIGEMKNLSTAPLGLDFFIRSGRFMDSAMFAVQSSEDKATSSGLIIVGTVLGLQPKVPWARLTENTPYVEYVAGQTNTPRTGSISHLELTFSLLRKSGEVDFIYYNGDSDPPVWQTETIESSTPEPYSFIGEAGSSNAFFASTGAPEPINAARHWSMY